MSKRRRAGAGRRIAEQRFWGGGSATGGQPTSDRAPAAGAEAGPNGTGPGSGPPAGAGTASGSAASSPGSAAAVPAQRIRPTTDPAAVVRSLGAPPFAIDASVGGTPLTAVYEEAVKAATALAAANGLLAPNEDDADG